MLIFPCAFSLLSPLYLFIGLLHSLLPSSRLSLGGGCSHQYLWLCYRRSTKQLLEGRAINGIQGRAAWGQQAGECGSVAGLLQSIPHYWLSISRGATHWTWLNLNEPKISLSWVEGGKNTDLLSRPKSEVSIYALPGKQNIPGQYD